MRAYFFFVLFLLSAAPVLAQDTFYVKKNPPRVVASPARPAWDSTNTDSIISYTAEYQKPNSNIYVRLHMHGPELTVPDEAYRGTRVILTEIIAVDQNGTRYRQPDRIWINGVVVPLKEPSK